MDGAGSCGAGAGPAAEATDKCLAACADTISAAGALPCGPGPTDAGTGSGPKLNAGTAPMVGPGKAPDGAIAAPPAPPSPAQIPNPPSSCPVCPLCPGGAGVPCKSSGFSRVARNSLALSWDASFVFGSQPPETAPEVAAPACLSLEDSHMLRNAPSVSTNVSPWLFLASSPQWAAMVLKSTTLPVTNSSPTGFDGNATAPASLTTQPPASSTQSMRQLTVHLVLQSCPHGLTLQSALMSLRSLPMHPSQQHR